MIINYINQIKYTLVAHLLVFLIIVLSGCNEKTAFTVLLNEAKNGNSEAQYNLWDWYKYGRRGAPQDIKEAVNWLQKAANQRHLEAQYQLGVTYQNGEDVEKNMYNAIFWIRRAAEQGHTEAQANLALMYLFGDGLEQDKLQAYKWFYIAAPRWEYAMEKRDYVANKMTQSEIEKAKILANEWIARNNTK